MTPRLALLVAGVAALALPAPQFAPGSAVATLLGLAALGAAVVRPGSAAPAALIGAAVLSWLLDAGDAGPGRLLGFVLAVSVVHHTAALAAVSPRGAAVDGPVLLRWTLRVAATAVAGAALVAATGFLPETGLPVATALVAVGLVVAVLVGAAALGLRKQPDPQDVPEV